MMQIVTHAYARARARTHTHRHTHIYTRAREHQPAHLLVVSCYEGEIFVDNKLQ